jgi:hypothetical protein
MKKQGLPLGLTAISLVFLISLPIQATSVLSMNLDELSSRAGGIFRGRVLNVRAGSVVAGGGTLPTTIYQVQVDESFKGGYTRTKKGAAIVEIRMIGSPKESATSRGPIRVLPLLPEVPRLDVGQEYLLFTTVPSRIGLSTTVGLGQGCFRVYRPQGREAVAVNAFDNRDLFRAMRTSLPARGPAPYAELARQIRASVAGRGRTP